VKSLGPASESDLPSGVREAFEANPDDVAHCMTCDGLRVRGHECSEPWPRRNNGGECPRCGRVMSIREADEQGACNDCTDHYGGARL